MSGQPPTGSPPSESPQIGPADAAEDDFRDESLLTDDPLPEEEPPEGQPAYTEYVPYERPRVGGAIVAKVAGFLAVLLFIGLVGLAIYAGAKWLGTEARTGPETIVTGIEVTFEIPSGASARSIGSILEDEGFILSSGAFENIVTERDLAEKLRAGSYTLVTGASTDELLTALTEGPPPVESYRITVIEGLRIEEMLASLADQTPYTNGDLAAVLIDGTVTSPYLPPTLPPDTPELTRWEGMLFPDTYELASDATPAEILSLMANTMVSRVESIDWGGLPEDVSLEDAIVVASLIEREAKLDEDRPLIASVIYNRLAAGQLLQIDATIIYALGENPGRVLFEDLEVDSPYNTYRFLGLPPTAIGGVRLRSLEAAAAPAETNLRYYVLVDPSGAHGFSETLSEHNQKVAKARADGVIP